MEIIIIFEILFLILLIINRILDKKLFKFTNELLEENENVSKRNIDLMQKEVELKNILDEAEEKKELYAFTIKKIKELFMTSNQDK